MPLIYVPTSLFGFIDGNDTVVTMLDAAPTPANTSPVPDEDVGDDVLNLVLDSITREEFQDLQPQAGGPYPGYYDLDRISGDYVPLYLYGPQEIAFYRGAYQTLLSDSVRFVSVPEKTYDVLYNLTQNSHGGTA